MNALRQFFRPSSQLPSLNSGLSRLEVRPPSLRHVPGSAWQQLMFWLVAPAPHEASPPLNRLPTVCAEFKAALADIANDARRDLMFRINEAHSLRDLWHMRMAVYNLIALHRSEFDAAQRLAALNRHFPVRTPRTGPQAL